MRRIVTLCLAFGSLASSAMSAENKRNLLETAREAGQFKTLLTAAQAAGLSGALTGPVPITLFAPSDDAFAKLPPGTVEALVRPENKAKLVAVLSYHIVPGRVSAEGARKLDRAETIKGLELRISTKGEDLKVNEATVVKADVIATNGVIHVIDRVLLPDTLSELGERVGIRGIIKLAIAKGVPLFNGGNPDACAAVYEVAAYSILHLGREDLDPAARRTLAKALQTVGNGHSARADAWTLRRALDAVYRASDKGARQDEPSENDSAYRKEAELPVGFPAPGPVGQVQVKQYPVYRSAVVDDTTSTGGAFMRLFAHIKRNGIAMTAPVEQTLSQDGRTRTAMAFVYERPTIGAAGEDQAGVRVVDRPAARWVSIGLRGSSDDDTIVKAVETLRSWLAGRPNQEEAGAPRLLGYNGPATPREQRYWEVQLPIRESS